MKKLATLLLLLTLSTTATAKTPVKSCEGWLKCFLVKVTEPVRKIIVVKPAK